MNMTLKEIANNIEKTHVKDVYLSDIKKYFNIQYDENILLDKLKIYWFINYRLGGNLYGAGICFLDDKPVGVYSNLGPMRFEEYAWFTKEDKNELKSYILDCMYSNDEYNDILIDKEICNCIYVSKYNQIEYWDHATYKDKPFELIEPIISDDNSPDYVKIRTYNGEEKTVSMEEINIEFNIKS